MSRSLPPAGFPLRWADLGAGLGGFRAPEKARRAVETALESAFPGRRARVACSGRAALYYLLRSCREARPERDEVALAAFTCWSVAAAAVRAGFRIRLIDLDPETYDFGTKALGAVPWERVAAVITHHLFGLPNDRGSLAARAEGGGAWVIDDAAQGFGAREGGAPLGNGGAAGVLSFGRGKSLPALGGGALLVDPRGPLSGASGTSAVGPRGAGAFLRACAYRAFLSRGLYGAARWIPFLGIGETIYEETFRLGPLDGFTAALASRLLVGAEDRAAARREAAAEYAAHLAGRPSLGLPAVRGGAEPAFIRFPVLVRPDRRSEVIRRAGRLGVSLSYPSPIHRIDALPKERLVPCGPLPGAERIAASLVTLPTHPLASRADRERIAGILLEVCA